MRSVGEFITELRRRRVIRAATVYLGVSWVSIGASDIFLPLIDAPAWTLPVIIGVLLIGLPFVLLLSWFFDYDTEGLRRDDGMMSETRVKHWDLIAIAVLLAALSFSVYLNLVGDGLAGLRDGPPLLTVVPFTEINETEDHISKGLAEELLNLLARTPTIRVMSVTTAFGLAQSGSDLLETIRGYDADYLVRGSIRSNEGSFRVFVRLVDVANGEIIWSKSFEGNLNELFVDQRTIALEVAESLDVAVAFSLNTQTVMNSDAVDAYLRGQSISRDSGSLEAIRTSQEHFSRALTLQPGFSAALGGLCRALMGQFRRTEDPEDFANAESRCLEALESDDSSPYTMVALASLYRSAGELDQALEQAERAATSSAYYEPAQYQIAITREQMGHLELAETSYKKSIDLEPRDWRTYLAYGNFLARRQRFEDGISEFERIVELLPDDFIGYASLGVTHYEAGNFQDAKQLLYESLKYSESSRTYFNLGQAHTALDEHEQAKVSFRKAVELNPRNYRAVMNVADLNKNLGRTEAYLENLREALIIADGLLDINNSDPYITSHTATILAQLGQTEQAIERAEQARELNQGNPKVQYNIGVTYMDVDMRDKAIVEFEEALKMGYPRDLFLTAFPDEFEGMESIRKLLQPKS